MTDLPAIRQVEERLARLASHDPTHPDVRMVVKWRARDACEYCLMPSRSQFHVDHVIPQHRWRTYVERNPTPALQGDSRGAHHLDNFAWSCAFCNGSKGDQIARRVGQQNVRLFHPRIDLWEEHFILTDQYLLIVGVTEIGRATERALGFHDARSGGPLGARHRAIMDGAYPPPWARTWGF